VREVLLGVLRILIFFVRIFHHFFIDVTQIFKHVDQHHSLLLHISLIGIADEVHVDFTTIHFIFSRVFVVIKGILLVEMVKVFITYLTCHRRLVRRNLRPHVAPVKAFEEGMGFYLFGSVATKTHFRVSNQFVQNISSVG